MPEEKPEEKKEFLKWEIFEYKKYQRGKLWYIVFSLIILFLLIYAFWTKNFFFSFLIILFCVIVIAHSFREPPKVTVSLQEEGIQVGNRFYAWKNILQFFIIEKTAAREPMLYLVLKSTSFPLGIPFQLENLSSIREILSRFIPENTERKEEPFFDWLSNRLKI